MNEGDYRDLIALVERELAAVGLYELADERLYVDVDDETDDARPLLPRQHLLEMLRAFERALAIRDRRTYDLALARINEHVWNEGPRGAFVVPAGDGPPVDLGSAPELGQVREELAIFIKDLSEADGENRFQ